MRWVVLCAVLALGCGDEPCATAVGGDGSLTVAAGDHCLRGVRARVLRDDGWHDDVTVDLTETERGAVIELSAAAPARAFELTVPEVRADRMLHNGYQSWSFSGATVIPAEVPTAADGAAAFPAAASGDVFDESLGVSYGWTAVGRDRGDRLVVGALSARRGQSGVAVTGDDDRAALSIVYGITREPLPNDGGTVTAEPIAIAGGPIHDALADLRDRIAGALPTDTPAPRRPPGGWFSWNERFADVDEAYIRDHIAIASSELAPSGLPLVEIDDGWQRAWGDWVENDRFAGGMAALAGAIDDAGLVAGIWMAPFLVDITSAPAQSIDPTLLVRDDAGDPIVHRFSGATASYYVLDGANPDAMALATDAIARLRTAGFRFFKLDFLYAGAFPGQRASGATGAEAFRAGMLALRAAAGDDAWINACGVPVAPVLGLADSLRIGADTAFVPPLGIDWSMVAYAARSYAARAFLFPLIWPDADQVQLREPFTEVQARAGAVVAALPGPAYSLGDDLTALPADRLAIAREAEILDLAGTDSPAVPVDPLEIPATEIVPSPGIEAVRVPGDTDVPPPASWRAIGASGTHYRIDFSWQAPHAVTISRDTAGDG